MEEVIARVVLLSDSHGGLSLEGSNIVLSSDSPTGILIFAAVEHRPFERPTHWHLDFRGIVQLLQHSKFSCVPLRVGRVAWKMSDSTREWSKLASRSGLDEFLEKYRIQPLFGQSLRPSAGLAQSL